MNVVKKSISLPTEMDDGVQARMRGLKYKKFSQYVQHLIEKDLEARGPHIRTETRFENPQPKEKKLGRN